VARPLAYLRRCQLPIATFLQFNIVFASFLLWAAALAYASDCPPGGYADCASAATTAQSPLVPLAGAVVGVFVNGLFSGQTILRAQGGDGENHEEKQQVHYTLDIRSQDLRTNLTADGEDTLWIYAQIRCDKPEIDVDGLTSSLTFDSRGPNVSWIRLEESQMVSGFKAVRVRAWPPTSDAQLGSGGPEMIVATIIDGNQVSGSVQLNLESKYVMEFV
jgi:hypothetical protein